MPQELSKTYDPAAIEERWATRWASRAPGEELWSVPAPKTGEAAGEPTRKPFTMLLPPPNVTGRLHMGHMLNQTEMDILARWHRMRGDPTLWVPGMDHASIATQMMVERQLASEGTSRKELGRERFLERAWQWKEEYGGAILEQMKRLGVSVDWSREYFTMNAELSRAVREAFVRLHEAGLIYRGQYIVNWDPVQQTAVSDLEVVHEERAGKLYHVRYPLVDGSGSIVIATTRPETMLGDVAVAVNPADARYTVLVGKLLKLPLSAANGVMSREIPVIADDWANPEFGTGAVKVTPAHDANDFAIGERHGLAQLTIMDAEARIDLPGSPYHGLDRFVARERIVEDLRTAGLLVDVKEHAMSIGRSQRTGAVIEPRLSTQWFLRTADFKDEQGRVREGLARKAREAVAPAEGEPAIRFTPDSSRKVYLEWMDSIRDWCISRQLWWGHRIPAWHCLACLEVTVARETPLACTHCGGARLEQDGDVLDTWFSAGLLPFSVFGWPEQTPGLKSFYPTSLLVTGSDILFFWVARMVMLGCWFMGDDPSGPRLSLAESVPFEEVYIHALVRDAERQKMSKTKGNVIDPIGIVQQYGTDAVRFTLASMASPGTDIAFSEARTEGYRAFANKIWNAARFIFMNVERARAAGITIDMQQLFTEPGSDELEARWIRAKFPAGPVNGWLGARDEDSESSRVPFNRKDKYRFDIAATHIYEFFWDHFCDWYLEIVKLRLVFSPVADKSALSATLRTLLQVFEALLRLLSPFMPFIAEELWHALYDGKPLQPSIALATYPEKGNPFDLDLDLIEQFSDLQLLVRFVRMSRKELGVGEKQFIPVRIYVNESRRQLFNEGCSIIQHIARVSEIVFVPEPMEGSGVIHGGRFDVEVIYKRKLDPVIEGARLTKEIAQLEKVVASADKQLGSEGFLAKAPPQIVAGLRTQREQNAALLHQKQIELDTLIDEG